MPGSSPGHAVYLNFAIGKHHNFAVTALVRDEPGMRYLNPGPLSVSHTAAGRSPDSYLFEQSFSFLTN